MKNKLLLSSITLFAFLLIINFSSNSLLAKNIKTTNNSFFAAPIVGNALAQNVSSTSVELLGVINSDGGSTLTERGFIYSISSADSSPTLAEVGGGNVFKLIVPGSGTGVFQETLTGLIPSTSYSFRPYAINIDGSGEGNIGSFTTSVGVVLPTVSTGSASIVTQDAAIIDINVTSDGGGTISENGVVFSLTSVNNNPEISGTGVTKTDFLVTGTGSHDQSISGLLANSNYTYRAYAINETGTSYGAVQTFTTISNPALTSSRYIVNGLGAPDQGSQGTVTASSTWVQAFTIDSYDVTLTAITIEAFGTGTVSISVRDASGNGAGNLIETLGNVSSNSATSTYQRVTSSTNPTLLANTTYYVHATHISGSLSWDVGARTAITGSGASFPSNSIFNNGASLPGPILDTAIEGIINCSAPTMQATAVVFGLESISSLTLSSFTPPSGGASGYVIYINDVDTFTAPSEGSEPVTDTSWNNSGQQAIYFGTSSSPSITITDLDEATTYYFRIYSYNECLGIEGYETTGLSANDTTDDNSLSVDTVENRSSFLMYPIPTEKSVQIKSTVGGNFVILNQLGQKVKTFIANPNVEVSIYVGDLSEGIYFVKATDSYNKYSQKLVIKK